jgi:hypothetical protein
MRGIITQSNYFPWRGFFASLRQVDLLVLYDSQQFTRRDWRNRNLIVDKKSPEWLTLHVQNSGNYTSAINQIRVQDENAIYRNIELLSNRYAEFKNKEGFKFTIDLLNSCRNYSFLSEINAHTIKSVSQFLDIEITISDDMYQNNTKSKTEKLLVVCKSFSIDHYFTGPAATDYLEVEKFDALGSIVDYFDYKNLSSTNLDFEPSIIHWIITLDRSELNSLTTFYPNHQSK